MWNKYILIVVFTLKYIITDVTCVKPTLCAYRNENFQINKTVIGSEQDMWLSSKIQAERNKTKGTFLDDGYERCDDSLGTSHCFTLWVKLNDSDEKRAVKKGCWIHKPKDSPNECQIDKCDHTALSLVSSPLSFCCCTGSKCNSGDKYQDMIQNVPSLWPDAPVVNTPVTLPVQNPLHTICAYKAPAQVNKVVNGKTEGEKQGLGMVLLDGKTAQCDGQNQFCFSYYSLDSANRSNITILYQGCWEVNDDSNACNMTHCIPYEQNHYKPNNNSYFCCCRGNLCNFNISGDYIHMVMQPSTDSVGTGHPRQHDPAYKERTILISLLSVFSLAILIFTIYLVYRFCLQLQQPSSTTNNNVEIPQSPTLDMEDLKICCLLVKGRYSEVWKGSLNDRDVAVKIYMPSYRQYYYNEKYIYSLPHIEHENILKFFGGEERILQDGSSQNLLVLQYVPGGTLMNYLKNNTIDWYTMCKMCQSCAKGMAHLHTDIGSGQSFKPTVAHRDINSRNVLVKPDLSCVIADLGFCMTTMGSKLIHKSHTENAEQTSLTDVGTLRYMAPELLDGAVNLRDCEASLKQIDMYAFGLVMWEIASRCSELYQGCPMPEFALPYQAEAGNHPTFEEMQLLVSRNKVRPKFPEVWKDYNQAIHALKETIEECWDHDAEARLTAMCVEERIVEMKMLWSHDNRNKANKGVTPTINTALLSNQAPSNLRPGYHGNGHTQWSGQVSNNESSSPNIRDSSTSALIINDIHHSNGSLGHSESFTTQQSWSRDRLGSFSTSTVETSLAPTPSDSVPSHPKSHNFNAMMNHHIPPHQGRNPTVERNTHKSSDEELAVVGNNLFYGKDHNEADILSHSESLYDSITDSLETSLMQNDALNHNRYHQIVYMQNRVHSNVRGNLELPAKVVNNPNERSENREAVAAAGSSNISVPKVKKAREMGLLGHLVMLGKLAFSGKFDGSQHENELVTPSRMENGRIYDSTGRHNPTFEPSRTVETEVRLLNSGTAVRPTFLKPQNIHTAVRDVTISIVDKEDRSNNVETDSNDGSLQEIQSDSPLIIHEVQSDSPLITHEVQSDSPLISRQRGAPYSKSTSDLSPEKIATVNSKSGTGSKTTRPSTLTFKGHNYTKFKGGSLNSLSRYKGVKSQKPRNLSASKKPLNGYKMIDKADRQEIISNAGKPEMNGSVGKQDIYNSQNGIDKTVLRNKSSLPEKIARYSLNDDRLMSNPRAGSDGNPEWKSSVSLQQFKTIKEHSPNLYSDCTC